MRTVLATVTMTFALVVGSFPAWAYFTSTGAGAATGVAASVPRPASVVATRTGEGTARVTWTSATSPLAVTDEVRRSNGTSTVTVCSSSNVRICDDAAVPPGTYTYTVVSRYRTWSMTSAPSAAFTMVDNVSTVLSFTRNAPASTNLAAVTWTVTFSESVSGPTTTNFAVTATGLSGAAITGVNGSGTTWTVTASTGTGSGSLTARLASASGITDSTGNPPTVPVTGETYAIRPFFPIAFTLTNGGSNNRIDAGDSLAITFSTAIDHRTLCGAWSDAGNHTSAATTVTVVDGGAGNDSLTFGLGTCPTLRLGTVALGSRNYVSGGSATFTARLTATASAITIVLGARPGTGSGAGSIGNVGGALTAAFTPDALLAGTSGTGAIGIVTSTGRF